MGAHHSQSLESWLAHVPGLKVVMPSNPVDAKGLLKAAIRGRQPGGVYRASGSLLTRGQVPRVSILCRSARPQSQGRPATLTIVATAKMLPIALEAAEELSSGISVEVIDPRTLSPLDVETIEEFSQKDEPANIVHEAVEQDGIGAEMSLGFSAALLPR